MNEPIEEKAPKPPGLLPKHVQSWLIVGLALLMVVIMWLTSPKKPQTQAKSNTPVAQPPAVMQVNQTEINELQNHIAELQKQELVAQNALAEQTKVLGNAPSNSQSTQPGESEAAPARSEDPIQSEQKKRAYLSLFASNVALSYRENPVPSEQDAGAVGPNPNSSVPATPGNGLDSTAQIAQLLKQLQPPIPAP